jgi:hypothetical protein
MIRFYEENGATDMADAMRSFAGSPEKRANIRRVLGIDAKSPRANNPASA